MTWQQMKPSLAEVCSSNIEVAIGETRNMLDRTPGSQTAGNTCVMVVVGVATREDFIKERKREPAPGSTHFYWCVFD